MQSSALRDSKKKEMEMLSIFGGKSSKNNVIIYNLLTQ
jgi:hypothetical protein